MAHEMEASRKELAGEYERVQKKAFTNWVNSHLVKVGQKVNDLAADFKDGTKLLVLLELLTNEKLPREKGKMRVHKLQNVQNALDFLQVKRRIKLVNIRNDEIVDGNQKLILGLIWTLILHFQISGAIHDDDSIRSGSRPTSPQEISAKAIKDHLLHWAQAATEGYEEVEVTNFHTSWSNGLAFCAILDRHRPDLLDYDDCDPDKPLENLEKAFKVAEEMLGIFRIVDPEDVCVPKPDEKTIMTYVSFLHQAFPDMPPPRKRKGPLSPEEYSDLYDKLKAWVGEKTEQVQSGKGFPDSTTDLRKELEEVEGLKKKVIPGKKKDLDVVESLHSQLEEQHQKKASNPGVPEGKELSKLQGEWEQMVQGVDRREKELLEELERREGLGTLARKVLSKCDEVSAESKSLAEEVEELEKKSGSMGPTKMADAAAQLSDKIQSMLGELGRLKPDVQTLKQGRYPEADAVERRVHSLEEELQSLLPRVEDASRAADSAQVLTEMEACLQELEVWLVTSGKFAPNQHILQQIQEHKKFEEQKLSKAKALFSRISSSPPPPGMEDKMKALEERFKNVVKHTEERLAGLDPILDDVLEFDTLRNKLEDWCLEQQEMIERLPPLEVTEEGLQEQSKECEGLLRDMEAHSETIEKLEKVAGQFFRDTEPVQSKADRYARKIKCSVTVKRTEEDEEEQPSIGEQANMLQSQFDWLKSRVIERSSQISDLVAKLKLFNQHYSNMREFVTQGNNLLNSEKPVGDSGSRIQEQVDTCQDFRAQIAGKQSTVDSMLSVGREVLAEPNTSSSSDDLMKKLTSFIQDWSDLQLGWQNWYDELNAHVEQTQELSGELKKFESAIQDLETASSSLFPATVLAKNLDKEMHKLQTKFNSEVMKPYTGHKATFEKLKIEVSLLPDPEMANNTFRKFEELSERVEGLQAELSGMVVGLKGWWGGCEGVCSWMGEVEESMVSHKPLASSVDLMEKQRADVKSLEDAMKDHEADLMKSVKALSDLAQRVQMLEPSPIESYKAALERRWKALGNDLETRSELCRCGRDYLSSYANDALPFEAWLKGAESRVKDMVTLPRSRDILLLEQDEMKAFCEDMKVHGETLTQLEIRGSSFLGSAKTYQGHLLAYQRKVDPDLAATPSKNFVDLRTEDLTSGEVRTNNFEGEEYQNGIRVVAGNSACLRRRYDALNAAAKQRQQVVKEGVARRKEFDSCLESVAGSLDDIEGRYNGLDVDGDGQPMTVQEKVELVRTLEVECMGLEPKLKELQAKYDLLDDLGQSDSEENDVTLWEGEDEALRDKDTTEHKYRHLLDKLKQEKEVLRDELTNAQVFYGAFENFVTWLRTTERKTQRDDPLKLEEEDLEKGLKHLMDNAEDIEAHRARYEEMCSKCRELIARGIQDGEDLQSKLNNVQQRWDAIQVVNEDIKEIEKTLPKLRDFHKTYAGMTSDAEALLQKIDQFSVSAISTDAVKAKSKGLQDMSGEVAAEKSRLDSVLVSCELLETPFDQSQFEKDVSTLKEQLKNCDQHLSSKRSELKALERKVGPMEDLFARFRAWIAKSQMQLASLEPRPSPADKVEREKALRQAQSIRDDVVDQKASLESLEHSVEEVLALLDDLDQEELKRGLDAVTIDYQKHRFACEGYLVEQWVEDKEVELSAMTTCGVQVQPLQDQLRDVQDFAGQVEGYRPHIDSLSSVAAVADPSEGSEVQCKMAELSGRYEQLCGLPARRRALLQDFLPTVQQYESSRGAWLDLLCAWEEKADQFASPMATPASITLQIDELKAMLLDVNDHEPEFTSLKREISILCKGPATEPAYCDTVAPLCMAGCPLGNQLPRPGEQEQNSIIEDYNRRLEELKRKMEGHMGKLSRQLKKGQEFEGKANELSTWVEGAARRVADLKIRVPKSAAISSQLQDCQQLAEETHAKHCEVQALSPLFSELTSDLPSENSDCESLQAKLDALGKNWEDLSQQLSQQQSQLEMALGLANVTEGSMGKLNPWVPNTLQRLKSLGPPPAEPELVQQQKAELEGLKVKYNSLAPAHASCMEDGQSLLRMCEEGEPRTSLEVVVADLNCQWEELQKLFGDLNEKLAAALAQSQEFQGTAKGLERWMSGMENLLRQQDRIAARCRLVEPQIEAFKLIVSDIDVYSGNLKQVTVLGEALMTESNSEERKKVEDRLASMTSQFQQLQEACQRRMGRLKQALEDASKYEKLCDKFDSWLTEAEAQLKTMPPFSMLSQPLKTQLERVRMFNSDIEGHAVDMTATTKAEEDLFATELPSIELCEEHLPSLRSSSSSSFTNLAKVKDPSIILPDWFDRPGAPEAVDARADLSKRYSQLKAGVVWLMEVGSEQQTKVEAYEEAASKMKDWLAKEKAAVDGLPPLATSLMEIEKQLKEVEDLQNGFKGQASSLEAVNTEGTALIDSCQDELSMASGRLALTDLNDSWGDTMETLAQREEDLRKRLALAKSYLTQLSEFEDWLGKPEEELVLPLRLEGSPQTLRKQLDTIKRLMTDVEAHEAPLASVVAAGQVLESAAGDAGLTDMEYTSARDRYNKIKNILSERQSALEEALGQASNLHDTLEDLLEQLKKMRTKLKAHEPPRVTPPAVEGQVKELQVMDKSYCELEPALAKCKEEGRSYIPIENGASVNGEEVSPDSTDIQSLLQAISESSVEVRGLLDHWRDLLASSLETAKKFDNDSTDLSTWLRGKTEELAAAEMVRGIPEGVQKQLDDLKDMQQEMSKQQQKLEELSRLCGSMCDSCSTEDSHQLRDVVSSLSASLESLQGGMLGRKRVLRDGLGLASDFASCWSSCMAEVEEKKKELDGLETVGADIDTVKTQLDEYKRFEESLSDLKSRITSTLGRGKNVREGCSLQDKPFLKDQMDKLNAAWSQLHSSGLERKHKLEDALLQLGQFHDALGEHLMWIANNTARLMEARPPGVEPSSVEAQIQDLQTIESGVASHAPSVVSLNEAGEKLLASSTAESSADVQQDLDNLNARWEELKDLACKRNAVLTEAMKKASAFHEGWKCEVGWLEEAELKAYADWKPCGLPRTCQADLDAHERFAEEVRSHEAQIEDVKVKGAALKAQGSPEDKKMVDRWVGDLLKRYDDLNFVLEEKKAQLEDASGRATNFDSLYKTLCEVLQKEQTVQAGQDPIHSEVDAVKVQMEQHKEHLKALSELEGKLDELNGWGQLLVKECVVPDGEVIQERLDSLKQQCDALTATAAERQAALEESLLSLGQFEGAYDDLWAWLVKANKQLEDYEPITGDPDAVSTQLARHKTLQKQLGARLASKNAVVRAGKQLMKHKSGEDKALLKKKLQNLEKEWEKVCQVSVDQQDKLEDAYMRIGVFRSHVAPLWSWMDKVLPSLDKSEPVHGDLGTVETLQAAHSAFQKDLGSFQSTADAANESGGHLIGEILDDPTITKDDLDRLNTAWDDLCQQAVDKQDRLEEAHSQAEKFEEGYNDLVSWVSAMVAELQNQAEPDEDATVLQQQIDENKALVQEVAARQLDYDRISGEGEGILQLAHPKAVPVLETKLQQLERKWLNLRGKIGARSEALASAQLEQHGLQDMLDSLQAWVSDAEKRMSDTEAMPIGSDLEAVEEQLAAHEAFQEEMATQQPNMDALNKAARKRKANHTSPELVKKISSLHKHWQKLWLRSSERHRQLLEARTRLKDIALARSFNFDNWKKRFVSWVDQQKLRVSDLFRRFDSNHDGMLTREEFMKALKASGLAMNQIELEKIADFFDKDRSGMIDLSDIMSTLKGGTSHRTRRRVVQEVMTDAQKIDSEIRIQVSRCTCEKKFEVTRVADGQYRFGDNQKLRLVRILRSTVMVRVGGGWEPLEEFLRKHDPCRASGRTNVDVRTMLQKGQGLDMTSFNTKTQTTITTKREHAASNGAPRKTSTATTRETTSSLASPKHRSTAQTRKTPPPKTSAARTSTPSSAGRSTTPIKRTRTPVGGSSPHHRTAAGRLAVSPDPTAAGMRRTSATAASKSPAQAASSTGTGTRTTGSRIPTPSTSKIPAPSKSRIPTKHT